jgi:tRNA (mo5U34)-methyltransferase
MTHMKREESLSDIRELPSSSSLREEVIRLGPWYLDVEITPELGTRASLEAPSDAYPSSLGKIAFVSPGERFKETLLRIYPNGLEGRSVLDCGCNCGGYLFWAKELGAGECLGFDVREHWIRQARFLARHRKKPSDGIRFEVCNLYDLPNMGLGTFDLTLFHGILYHLPDPVTGLKIAADLTSELLILDTATRAGYPDGALVVARESTSQVMSGVYGLSWFPTGPRVLSRVLNWMGFAEARCTRWRHAERQPPNLDMVEMLAAREHGVLASFDASCGEGTSLVLEIIRTSVRPGATVLVASKGDDELLRLDGRVGWHFPRNEDGTYTGYYPADSIAAIAHLEDLRARGAHYLAFPEAAFWWLDHYNELADHLERHYPVVRQDEHCLIFELRPAGSIPPEIVRDAPAP